MKTQSEYDTSSEWNAERRKQRRKLRFIQRIQEHAMLDPEPNYPLRSKWSNALDLIIAGALIAGMIALVFIVTLSQKKMLEPDDLAPQETAPNAK